MSFDDRFELGELVRDDGIRTFLARDKTGGQDLLAHFFANSAEIASLLVSLERLPERERQRIVDRGEREGTPYVVTGTLAEQAGFREWLAANAREARPLGSAGAWKVIPAQASVDEQFLSLFPTVERAQVQPEEAPRHAEQREAGEFTRLFQAPAPQPSVRQPSIRQPSAPQPAAQSSGQGQEPGKGNEPGEFTRLFQAPPDPSQFTPAQPAPAQAPKKADAPGEFTRFFEAQVPQTPARQMDTPPLQVIPTASKQGEFTRVFGPGQMRAHVEPAPQPPPTPRAPEPAAQATRVFASPPAVSPVVAPPSAGPSSSAPPSMPPQGRGDYTMRFSATPALSLGQPAETPAASSSSIGNASSTGSTVTSRWPLILGIAAVVVLLAAVVLFFVSRVK